MRRIVGFLVFFTIILGIYSEEQFLWCKRLFVNEPRKHVIQEGEYFSKLSLQYYGTATYWRELALVNRAPNSDLVFPGERIIVPSLDGVKKLRKSRSLSAVNRIVEDQEQWLANHIATPRPELAAKPKGQLAPERVAAQLGTAQPAVSSTASSEITASVPSEVETSKYSSLTIALIIVAIVATVAVIGLYFYKRRQNRLTGFDFEVDDSGDSEKEFSAEDEVLSDSLRERHKEEVIA